MYEGEGCVEEDVQQVWGHPIGSWRLLSGCLGQGLQLPYRWGGGFSIRGACWTWSAAPGDHGLFRCRILWIFLDGMGSVDGVGGVSSVCFTRR